MTGGGVATHYWLGAAATGDADAFVNFWFTLSAFMPTGVSITVPEQGEVIDDNTGDLVGTWNLPGESNVFTGGVNGTYAKGVGCRVTWLTAGTTGNRRVRGTTYIVPLASNSFDNDGTLLTTRVEAIKAAADALVGDLPDRLAIVTRVTPEHSGTSHAVTSTAVPDTPSWLRSRRT